MPPMHTCNDYTSCIGLLNLLGRMWERNKERKKERKEERKKKRKNMRGIFLKRIKTCHESWIWEKLLIGEGSLQRKYWPHNWETQRLVLCCIGMWLNWKPKNEKKENMYLKTIDNLIKICCAIQEILKKYFTVQRTLFSL